MKSFLLVHISIHGMAVQVQLTMLQGVLLCLKPFVSSKTLMFLREEQSELLFGVERNRACSDHQGMSINIWLILPRRHINPTMTSLQHISIWITDPVNTVEYIYRKMNL